MNHNQSPEDLSAALHGIADGVDLAPPSATDAEFATIVHKRTHMVRRRHQRIGIITSCLALVAVGGVVLVKNLPGSGTPAASVASQSAAANSAVPTCGAAVEPPMGARRLTLLSQVDTAAASAFLSQSAPADKQFYTHLGNEAIVPLELMNDSDETLTVGSTGYVRLVIAQSGVVVAESDLMPEPYTSPTLKPGETTPINPTGVVPCKGTELKDGDYDVYAFLDADVSTGATSEGATDEAAGPNPGAESMVVHGGPSNIRLGSTQVSVEASSEYCGEKISAIPTFIENELTDLTTEENWNMVIVSFVDGPQDELDLQPGIYGSYLVSDNVVVASATEGEKLDLDLDDLRHRDFPIPTTSCDGTLMEPGSYQYFFVVDYTDAKTGTELETIRIAFQVTVPAK